MTADIAIKGKDASILMVLAIVCVHLAGQGRIVTHRVSICIVSYPSDIFYLQNNQN